MQHYVKLKDVNLSYYSQAFRETSFKSFIFKFFSRKKNKAIRDVHALIDINISLQEGDRVGLLGHNGAGKSTFLKAVAGLYPLSSGIRDVNGEIRGLFELSLGFEHEATGRENILYRGLMLGKKPSEMRALEAEIIDFAELGDFIDYPIKTYSAGMQVRLAFAISTMVTGDILLLDEVLGAGDTAFMQKAKAKIHELINQAQILILASHDLNAISTICNRVLVFEKGTIIFDGDVDEGIAIYNKNIKVKRKVGANLDV